MLPTKGPAADDGLGVAVGFGVLVGVGVAGGFGVGVGVGCSVGFIVGASVGDVEALVTFGLATFATWVELVAAAGLELEPACCT
ncbi:MAG: hypothetical protein ACXV2D_06480 [Halobacteriota archaeon]